LKHNDLSATKKRLKMPELPEVETMCRGIAGIVGRRIRGLERPRSRLKPIEITPRLGSFRRRTVGTRIVAVRRIAKRVVVDLDSEDSIIFEPRMTGRVLLVEPPDTEHLRLVFDLSGRPAMQLLFWNMRGFGVVRLFSPRQLASNLGPDKLGADALDISAADLRDRLSASRRAVKVAILDQRAVAGIGNIYASEILHRAGVHPEVACNRLRPIDWKRIHAEMGEVLREAILCQGSTLSDGNYRNAQNEAGSFQDRHRVYQKDGQKCTQCDKATIVRAVQAQRATFYCPRCQRQRR
jgi:formamidopyrimidine-DNA glycosylase